MTSGPFSFGVQPENVDGWCRVATRYQGAARTLLAMKHPAEAWNSSGFAVECALKAAVMVHQRFNRFPSRDLRPDLYTHDLKILAREAGIDFRELVRDPIAAHFQTVLLWSRSEGYNPTTMPMRVAEDMVSSVCGPSGVIQWLATRYRLTI